MVLFPSKVAYLSFLSRVAYLSNVLYFSRSSRGSLSDSEAFQGERGRSVRVLDLDLDHDPYKDPFKLFLSVKNVEICQFFVFKKSVSKSKAKYKKCSCM